MKTLYQYILEADDDLDIDDALGGDDEGGDDTSEDTNDESSDDAGDDSDNSKDDDKTKDDKKVARRGNIKFTIWKEPKKKVNWLEEGETYQKIEYKHIDKDKGIEIHFLLGQEDATWKLWIGKIGTITYDDDPWCSFDTKSFAEGIVQALDKVEEFIDDVEENPDEWPQFYVKI